MKSQIGQDKIDGKIEESKKKGNSAVEARSTIRSYPVFENRRRVI
jgi:hypothetical protein